MLKQFTFRVVGANVRNNPVMPRVWVEEDYHHAATLGDVLLLNEVGRRWYKALLRWILGPGFKVVGLRKSETPIAFRRSKWRLIWRQIYKMHEGHANASPTRRVVVALLQHKRTGLYMAFVCSHRVSGAWNNKLKAFKFWRKKAWMKHDEGEKVVLLDLYDRGITWLRFADFNRLDVDPVHDEEVLLMGHNNIVKMTYLVAPGGVDLGVLEKEMIRDVHTDHPMEWARIQAVAPVAGVNN